MFFGIILIIVSVLLGAIVLFQNSKGGGLNSSIGVSNQLLGVQRTTESVEKITWGLIIALMVLTVASGFSFNSKSSNDNPLNGYEPLKTTLEVPVQQGAPNSTVPNGQPQGQPQPQQ